MNTENQITLINENWSVPVQEQTGNLELAQIITEFRIADALNEIARYRIWRLHKTGSWRDVVDDDGNQKYNTWEELIIDISEQLNCGRQQLYDRVRIYEQLYWLGYTPEESVKMVSEQPSLYGRALNKIMDWDQRNGEPKAIYSPGDKTFTDTEAKEYVRGILSDAVNFSTQKEALEFISADILLEPQTDLWYDGEKIHYVYYAQTVDQNGNVVVKEYERSAFYPDKTLTYDAKEMLETIFKKVGKFDANRKTP